MASDRTGASCAQRSAHRVFWRGWMMQGAVFENVWFRYSESSWSEFELTAWQDTGTLEVSDGSGLGWDGILGGTSRLGAAIAEAAGRVLGAGVRERAAGEDRR